MSTFTRYDFPKENPYDIVGKIKETVKCANIHPKMTNVKKYLTVYTIKDENNNTIFKGRADNDLYQLHSKMTQVKIGYILVDVIEDIKH